MEKNFGGPVWHASVRTKSGDMSLARMMAQATLEGRGDASAGEWSERGPTAFHIRRRLSEPEVVLARGLAMRDIRGMLEERKRIAFLLADAPHLRQHFGLTS